MTHDVAVVGAGPTGLTLANLLGATGRRVLLVERNETTVDEPRAVSIDDEALRTLQSAGLISEVLADVALDYGAHYFTAAGACFAKVEPTTREFGFPRRNAFTQPKLEATLRHGLTRFANVTAHFGYDCEQIAEDRDGISLVIRPAGGQPRRERATYLVGCDGAHSSIRRLIGASLEGSTYQQRWLIVDLASTSERFRHTRVVCDPKGPMITLPGPHGIRRYEFMLCNGESDEQATDPEFTRRLLTRHGPDAAAPVVRRRVYTFHARVADRWGTDRIFLAGDAAHLSPPFAGQGMNSGIRDAHNLAWKLAAVLDGSLGPGLLMTYVQERAPHARALIEFAVNLGRVMVPASRLQAYLVQSGLRVAQKIVPPLHRYFAEMKYKPKPHYHDGFLGPVGRRPLVGRMLPQPLLELSGGQRIWFDDAIGPRFAMVAYGPSAPAVAAALQRVIPPINDTAIACIVPPQLTLEPQVPAAIVAGRDIESRLSAIAGTGADALLFVRPDRYVAVADVVKGADVESFVHECCALVDETWSSALQGRRTGMSRTAGGAGRDSR